MQRINKMMHGSGSNTVKTCSDLSITHFLCISHRLHLLLTPFMLEFVAKQLFMAA